MRLRAAPPATAKTADGSGIESFLGDAYEIAIKRGMLAALSERSLLPDGHPAMEALARHSIARVSAHIRDQMGVTDDAYAEWIRRSVGHLALTGFLSGATTGRELLRRVPDGAAPRGLWCPIDLPDRTDPDRYERDREAMLPAFWSTFRLVGRPSDSYTDKGGPAKADFMLLLDGPGQRHFLLCLEFSLHSGGAFADWTRQEAHLAELTAWVRRCECRGVFSHLSAEISGAAEGAVHLSDGLLAHLGAFAGRDKPLYKLAQASAYAARFATDLRLTSVAQGPLEVMVAAVTSGGIEAAQARLAAGADPRDALGGLARLASGYFRARRGGDEADFLAEGTAVLEHLRRALPTSLRADLESRLEPGQIGWDLDARLSEEVIDFTNPAGPVAVGTALEGVVEDETLRAFFGGSGGEALIRALGVAGDGAAPLRDVHGAAVKAALRAAKPRTLQVLALEGNPGIGKTTAVRNWLSDLEEGWLFVYLSPRVLINSDVTRDMAAVQPSEVLTLTTNATLISGAAEWYARQPGRDPRRKVEAAVRFEGTPPVAFPEASGTIALSAEEADTVEADFGSSGARTRDLDIRTREAMAGHNPGVLGTLAGYAREVLDANLGLRRLVLAAAIQGYRRTRRGTTIAALDNLFRWPPDTPRGAREREVFARRFPRVVVMVDEIAGDPAGAPLVHDLAAWMRRQFVDPFGGPSGPRPSLVIADASLGNDLVLTRYLQSGGEAPERVLISPGRPGIPFRMKATRLAIGGPLAPPEPVLHVMTDSFPASRLSIEYGVSLDRIEMPLTDGELPDRPFRVIEETMGERRRARACREIMRAIDDGARQVIFFAQHKSFLREACTLLTDSARGLCSDGTRLRDDDVAVIDSSVPERRRRYLIRPEVRDQLRVVLMTSSGARGINFPLATHIVAAVPRFSIESGLMEIVQLVYRGRGRDALGQACDGLDRRITLILEDFVLADPHEVRAEIEYRRRWLRQATDVVTFLLLLRGCVLTRVGGDAGIPGRRLAVVPVGRIGVEHLERSMSEGLRTFFAEADTAIRDKRLSDRQIALVRNAQEGLSTLMRDIEVSVRRRVWRPDSGFGRWMAETRDLISDPDLGFDALVRDRRPPEDAYAVGPLWFEACRGAQVTETIFSDPGGEAGGRARQMLLNQLWRIGADDGFPGKIRRATRDLHRYLRPPEGAASGDGFRTLMALHEGSFWALQPIDPVGLTAPSARDRALGRATAPVWQPEVWLALLERAAGLCRDVSLSLPVLPAFEERPFLVFSAQGDVTGLHRSLDDTLFMASRELNLLNTILLGEADATASQGGAP